MNQTAQESNRPVPKVGPLKRYGPVVVILLVIVGAGVVATMHATSNSSTTTTTAPANGRPGGASNIPVTYQLAKQAGRLSSYDFGPGCDPKTGRLKMPTNYAPVCVPVFNGKNGGATASGVTGTTIKVVYYQAPPGDLASAITGATDTLAASYATAKAYVAMLNSIVETYGRKVVLVNYDSKGASTDAVMARADAITVAQQIHAFASIGGPAQTAAYEDELASLHVLCLGCGLSVPQTSFLKDAPYLWSDLPAPDTLVNEVLGFTVGELLGKKAVYAGEPAFQNEKRVFGIVHYDQNPPVFGALSKQMLAKFSKYGLKPAVNDSYLLDLPELPAEAATLAAKLKQAGVTTVIFIGDPIMPIYLTKAAAAINYFPEWVISGTVFTDTSTLGRLYNQQEWAHAFGITPLGVPTPIALSDGWTLYRWYYGTEPPAKKTANVVLPSIRLLFNGIELSGSDLTPANFQAGVFRYPVTGGGPTTPLVAYGYKGAPPVPSYAIPADYAVVWYNAKAVGQNEEGVNGTGLIEHALGGRRFPPDTILRGPLGLFNSSTSVTTYQHLPPADQPPSYPPWPGSPTAKS